MGTGMRAADRSFLPLPSSALNDVEIPLNIELSAGLHIHRFSKGRIWFRPWFGRRTRPSPGPL
jgi:hypothetical protein